MLRERLTELARLHRRFGYRRLFVLLRREGEASGINRIYRLYREEGLFERARALEPKWADAVMGLRNEPNVVDIRTVGITAGIDLTPRKDGVGARGFEALERAFHEQDLMIRVAADTIALTPPLIVSESQIGEIMDKVAKVIRAVA